jgi:uncharacterized protein (TIGR01244 family)
MQPKRINASLSVSEQILPEALAGIAAAGFRSIICNRLDGEGADQPGFAEIEAAAEAAGLQAAYQPVISGQVQDSDAAAFGTLFASLPKPVFAYCRTGTRSATLWSLSEAAQGRPLPEIIGATKAAGYDMSAVGRRIANGGRTRTDADGAKTTIECEFDMLHAVPPQTAPDFIRVSPLADAAGWVDVEQATLRHKTLPGVYGLGDACNAPNAKTAAASRKQAPVVAHNLLKDLGATVEQDAIYDGYGSCPLTVERGKIVLAEFGYGGKLLPSFPTWLIDGTQPSHLAWLLKERMLPPIYWQAMLRGREWMAKPQMAA